jgi:hypothetical protein
MTDQILDSVYSVFGKELPEYDIFQATVANTVSLLDIKRNFGTWSAFEYAYAKFLAEKTVVKQPTAPAAVTKEVKPDVTE